VRCSLHAIVVARAARGGAHSQAQQLEQAADATRCGETNDVNWRTIRPQAE